MSPMVAAIAEAAPRYGAIGAAVIGGDGNSAQSGLVRSLNRPVDEDTEQARDSDCG